MTTPLTGAQRTQLRGLGQQLADTLHVGREGATAAAAAELDRLLDARGLVKLRFTGGQDRHARAALSTQLATAGRAVLLGTVGHTALFWRDNAAGRRLLG